MILSNIKRTVAAISGMLDEIDPALASYLIIYREMSDDQKVELTDDDIIKIHEAYLANDDVFDVQTIARRTLNFMSKGYEIDDALREAFYD